MRLVTPDLEEWANTYLVYLVQRINSSDEKIEHLEWLKLELLTNDEGHLRRQHASVYG